MPRPPAGCAGPRAIKWYKKLMLRRIKWNEDASGVGGGAESDEASSESDDDAGPAAGSASAAAKPGAAGIPGKPANRCILVWEGSVKAPAFKLFTLKQCPTPDQARDYLKRFKVEHYWDFAKNYVDKEF